MLFNSVDYLLFFPIVILIYYLIPDKWKHIWLLVASYYFYMCWNAKYALLIFASTMITYICALILEAIKQSAKNIRRKKLYMNLVVASSALLNFSVVFYYKYINFALYTFERGLNFWGIECDIPSFDIILPVGISFFTFQAVGYTIDVYRNEIVAERNFGRYALFVSFFPQLVAGPIERSKNLLNQLKVVKSFDVYRTKSGLLTIGYGLFLKIVIADNIANIIDPIFAKVDKYTGMELFLAVALFAFQVYCDFEGYTKMAIGSAEILGYHLNNNFNAPYMALSVKDFWRRWHISLTSWFRDYLYIPLGGSRKGTVRKQINTLIIFLCSGLWHGAAWHYVLWGGLNGLLSVAEDLLKPIREKWMAQMHINEDLFAYRLFRRITTFLLISITWVFFRAESVGNAMCILVSIIKGFQFKWFIDIGWTNIFFTSKNMMIVLISLFVLFLVDFLQEKKYDLKKIIFEQQIVFRWLFYWLCFMVILYWGAYGLEYEQKQFIYFQF